MKERKEVFRPFLKAAGEKIKELAARDGVWEKEMKVDREGDVEMEG